MATGGKRQVFDRFTLENGLMMVGERIPHFRSVSVGLWVKTGSVNEGMEDNGYSHFIEHMLFKGTEKRTARRIAEEMDAIGGQMNAFTSKECTCYYVKVMDEHLPRAMDLISDIALNSVFDKNEMEKEKLVVGEEISMVEDTPEDLVHELLSDAHFGEHPLAKTILGPAENIESVTREQILAFKDRFYHPGNAVLSVAGQYQMENVKELAEQCFGKWQKGSERPGQALADISERRILRKEKPIEQTHICIAYPGIEQGNEDLYALSALNNALGGGMSSRLFQRIREENGMAYSVYSYPSAYAGCGMFAVYAGTSPKNAQQVVEMIGEEIEKFLREGIGKDEFIQSKDQLKGSFILGQEATSSRMTSIGRSQLLLGRLRTEAEVLELIDKVTMDDVTRVAESLLTKPFSASVVGPRVDIDFSCVRNG